MAMQIIQVKYATVKQHNLLSSTQLDCCLPTTFDGCLWLLHKCVKRSAEVLGRRMAVLCSARDDSAMMQVMETEAAGEAAAQ